MENGKRPVRAVEADLGIVRHSSSTPTSPLYRHEVMGSVEDIQRRADQLMNQTAPHTVIERILDRIAPSAVRREKARGDQALVRAEVDAQVTIHQHVKEATVRRMAAFSNTYAMACELEAAKEIAARGLEVAARVDEEIDRCGAEFDESIDFAVDRARTLRSNSALDGAADRIERRKAMRGEIEELVMEEVRKAMRRPRR